MARGSKHPSQYKKRKATAGSWKPGQPGNPNTMWKPGVSANPGGRPKFKLVSDAMKDMLTDEDETGKTRAHRIAQGILDRAEVERGDAELLLERTEGKTKQVIENQGSVDLNVVPKGELVDKLKQLLAGAAERSS